jgi:uncharacterized membrane protein YgdD (TMEM256/DUF423 family)
MNVWLAIAAVNGFLAVGFGAFAAHGLSGRIDSHALQNFETGARYHMYHALAIGLVAVALRGAPADWAAGFFLLGIVLFSGSLYLFAVSGFHPLVFVTPVGGLSFLAGWALLAWAATRVST